MQRDLIARIAEIREKAQMKGRNLPDAPPSQSHNIKLPDWPDLMRGVPNVALRSALFGAVKKGARPYLERSEIHAQDGISICYTGARLDQGDLDAWETVLHLARNHLLDSEFRIRAYQFLKVMNKQDTGGNRNTLNKRLARLKATALEVKIGHYSYMGSLIDEVYQDEKNREYVIRLNTKLKVLFEPDQFTRIDWAMRHALEGQPLAQWLYGYYASHARPYAVKAETLLRLSGSTNSESRSNRQKLRKALDAVAQASQIHGQAFHYEICGDMVQVVRQISTTQQRHLTRRNSKTIEQKTGK